MLNLMNLVILNLFKLLDLLHFSITPFFLIRTLYFICLFVFFIKFNAFSPPVFFFKLIFVHLFELLKFDDPFSQVNEKVKYKFYLLNSKNRQKFYHKFL
jgi:hypothetical protein